MTNKSFTSGRLGLYGKLDVGEFLVMTGAIRGDFPEIELVGEPLEEFDFHARHGNQRIEDEVGRIRKMGKITTEVVGMVASYLTHCEVREDEVLLKEDGTPLTCRRCEE